MPGNAHYASELHRRTTVETFIQRMTTIETIQNKVTRLEYKGLPDAIADLRVLLDEIRRLKAENNRFIAERRSE
jgi:hypothetical protein